MSDSSPFLNGILSPPVALNIGATLLSPDETPFTLMKTMKASVMRTPLPTPSAIPHSTFRSIKKRQRGDTDSAVKADRTDLYRIIPGGKNFRLQPYVVRLLEQVASKGTIDVLKEPLFPDELDSESEHRRKIRLHLRRRFHPVNEYTDVVALTRKLVELWGGKLHRVTDSSFQKNNPLYKFITPLRRSSAGKKEDDNFNDLEDEELLKLDFLDDEEDADLDETMDPTNAATAEDNWACEPMNFRRVTYHATPPTTTVAESSNETQGGKGKSESKAKKAKSANPKRGMRWSASERKLFLQGLERYGAGNWKSIHKIIPGRTYVQVKSMGVYLVSKFHMSRGQGPSKPVTDYLMAST